MTLEVREINSLDEIEVHSKTVVVDEPEEYPGSLIFVSVEEGSLQYPEYIDGVGLLNDLSLYSSFVERLHEDGWEVVLMPSSRRVLEFQKRWSEPLTIDGLSLTSKKTGESSTLHPYQEFGIQKALTMNEFQTEAHQFYFWNCGTGSGKTVMGCAGALELFNRDEIDVVLFFTLRQLKLDVVKHWNTTTPFVARNIEGEKSKRIEEYQKRDAQLYVLNYEKAQRRVDFDSLMELCKKRRVLFIFDECQKILNQNTARKGLNEIMKATSKRIVWAMSASVVDGDPERFYNTFKWAKKNPLGTLTEFRKRYILKEYTRKIKLKDGRSFWIEEREYDPGKLGEVKYRVSPYTHLVRKTDPGVREYFKGLTFNPVEVEMDPRLHRFYRDMKRQLKAMAEEDEGLVTPTQTYQVLRYLCLSPLSLFESESPLCQEIASEFRETLGQLHNNKEERLVEDLQILLDGGDKVVAFTHWTNMSLHILAKRLKKEKIPFVVNHGALKQREIEESQNTFKTSKSPMVFLSSDAGSHGLNLPEARVVINYECPLSFDTLYQRNSRIDRADSYHDGLESRVYIYLNTLEEKVWKKMNERRLMASSVQGTEETLGTVDTEDAPLMDLFDLID